MNAIVKIEYTGSEASCLIECDATAQTITSKIGALGAESADPNFGTAGVLDFGDYTKLEKLVEAIDGYDDYSAELTLGDDSTAASGLLDATVYAKPDAAYIVLSTTVVLAAQALITWEFAKARLGYADEQQDTVVFFINSASKKAEQYARRKLAARDYTEKYDGHGREDLILKQYPINSVTDVRIDGDRAFGSGTIVTDYFTEDDVGILVRDPGVWPTYRKGIQVTYNAGYSSVPEDLQEAVLEVVAWSVRRIASKSLGVRSASGEGMTTEYELTIPTNAQRVFESYQDWRVA